MRSIGDDEIDIMVEEIKALRLDRARLEWLVCKEAFPMKSKEGWCLTSDGNTCWGVAAKTWRDAIDEAMRGDDECDG